MADSTVFERVWSLPKSLNGQDISKPYDFDEIPLRAEIDQQNPNLQLILRKMGQQSFYGVFRSTLFKNGELVKSILMKRDFSNIHDFKQAFTVKKDDVFNSADKYEINFKFTIYKGKQTSNEEVSAPQQNTDSRKIENRNSSSNVSNKSSKKIEENSQPRPLTTPFYNPPPSKKNNESKSLKNTHLLPKKLPQFTASQPLKTIQVKKESDNLHRAYSGLLNQGATCYMNSLLQALYHLPAFRRVIYKMPTDPSNKKSIISQMQLLFANMQLHPNEPCSTRALTQSFGWNDSDTFMQHDVQEFCRVILDNLETKIDKEASLKGSIQKLFRGRIRSYIRCKNVDFQSHNDADFYDISLLVKDCNGIEDSFQKYVEPELLVGKNQYRAEGYGLQDAIMGIEFLEFPPVLYLHLKRFDFNGYGMSKINTRFEFHKTLNLNQFLSKDSSSKDPPVYQLFGVLVHDGTASSGHYYAYLRPTQTEDWYKFNDSFVSPCSEDDAIANNYGGFFPFKRTLSFSYEREINHMYKTYSAYMLIYIRENAIEEIYNHVSKKEISPKIQDYIRKKEEERKEKEKEKWIRENTITFQIYFINDFQKVARNNKLDLPNSLGSSDHKFPMFYGDKYEKLLNSISNRINKPVDKFKLYPINYNKLICQPISKSKIISRSDFQSLMLIYNNELSNDEAEDEFSDNDSLILFVFAYFKQHPSPIRFIKAIRANKKSIIKKIFENSLDMDIQKIYIKQYSQTIEIINDINSSFEDNKIVTSSLFVIDTSSEPELMPNEHIELSRQNLNNNVIDYCYEFPPLNAKDYFEFIRNSKEKKVCYNEITKRINYPTNLTIVQFCRFLAHCFHIEVSKTIVLYESGSKVPIKFDLNDKLISISRITSFQIYAFDFILMSTLYKMFRIDCKISKKMEISDKKTIFLDQSSLISDLIKHEQYHTPMFYAIPLERIRAFGINNHRLVIYENSMAIIQINTVIFIEKIPKDQVNLQEGSQLIHIVIKKDSAKMLKGVKSRVNTLFRAIDGELFKNTKKRLCNRYKWPKDKLTYLKFSVSKPANFYQYSKELIDNDILFNYMKDGYTQLKISLLPHPKPSRCDTLSILN